jgi:uncharacterized protein YbjT (DUF2867 family)
MAGGGQAGPDVVTGAFSFTGRHIALRLLATGRRVRTLTGHPDRPDPFGGAVEAAPLRLGDPDGLAAALRGADTLYNTFWIRFRRGDTDHAAAVAGSRALLAAAARAGVRRIVHVSITGADPRSPLPYFRGKGLVEEALRSGPVPWAILRPALIFGDGDVLLHNIAWIARRLPVLGVFGDGRYPVQPVAAGDLADLALAAAAGPPGFEADAVGPETYAYRDLVAAVAAAVGRRPRIVSVPPAAGWAAGALIGALVRDVVVTRDEIAGLMAGLLRSQAPPTCPSRLSAWLRAQGPDFGRRWVSELRRHYDAPRRGRATP